MSHYNGRKQTTVSGLKKIAEDERGTVRGGNTREGIRE